jgi:lauroyl/myristoyl acyltransferase
VTRRATPGADQPPARRAGLGRRLSDWLVATFVIAGAKLISHLPEGPLWRLGNVAGTLEYRASPTRRNLARRNLRRVVEWMAANGKGSEEYTRAATNPKALEALVRSAFRHHAHYSVELARVTRFDASFVNERLFVETPHEVEAWLTERRALILLGMHFGAIELPGVYAVHRLGSIVTPMETVRNARIQRYLFSTRATIGVHIVTLEEAGLELVAAIRRNEPVGLVADRDLGGTGLEVVLFGAKTKIPAGPAFLAVETGVPAYVSAVRRAGPGRYRGSLWQVPAPEGANRRERMRAMAREEARLFEQLIMEAPEQWLALFHPIWPDLEQAQMRENGTAA